jgi:hypothetical protein
MRIDLAVSNETLLNIFQSARRHIPYGSNCHIVLPDTMKHLQTKGYVALFLVFVNHMLHAAITSSRSGKSCLYQCVS